MTGPSISHDYGAAYVRAEKKTLTKIIYPTEY